MRKGWIIAFIIATIVLFGIGVFIGIYAYQNGKTQDSNMLSRQLAQQEESQRNTEKTNEAISTSVAEVKLSPNCTIVEKQYFKGCDHLIKNIKDIPEEWINNTEGQIKEEYSDWKLESFSNNQVIVSQEKEGFCGEHYVIREHDGLLAIYTLNENGEETLKEDTEISTMYLTDDDMEKIKDGIKVIGDDQLHKALEDFE